MKTKIKPAFVVFEFLFKGKKVKLTMKTSEFVGLYLINSKGKRVK